MRNSDSPRQRQAGQWRRNIDHLLDAVAKVAEYTDKKEILQTTAIKMVYLLEGETCIVSTWDPKLKKVTPEAFHTSGGWRLPQTWFAPRSPAAHPLFLRVQEEKRSVQFNLGGMTLPLAALQMMERDGIQSWVAFPLMGNDHTLLGVVDVLDSREPRHFRNEMVGLGELLANLASATYQRAMLYERTEDKARQLTSLMNAAAAVASTLSLTDVLKKVAQAMAELVEVSMCAISDYDERLDSVRLLARYHENEWEIDTIWQMPFALRDYPLTARVLQQKEAIQLRTTDPDADPAEKELLDKVGANTLLMLPLISEERAIGLVELVDKQNFRTFTQEEIELLKILSAHAAKAMKNAQIYESEQNQRRLAEALAEAAKSLNTSLDLNAVLDTILEQTIVVMQCESAHLMMVRGELAQVVGHRGYEMHPGALANIRSLALPANIATFEEMRVSRKPILIPDTQAYKGWVNVEGYDWVRSFASSPLFLGNDLIGFLNLDSEIPGFFKESILPGLEALASHAAIALNNAQLYQDIEQRASELEAVRQASLTVTSSLDLDHLLTLILQQSFKLNPGLVSGHIFLYQDGKLSFGAAIQLDGSTGKPFAKPREDGLTYTVARSGEMIVVGDMQNHPLFRNMPPDWSGSIVGIPIKYGKRVVGVMNIAHPQTYYFQPPQVRMLKLLSDQAAISIVNARLHNVVEEQSRTDPLTRLNNRRAFDQRLGEETQRSERFSHTFTLALMDLDGFKKINDTFGHPVGDKLLIEISKNLQRSVRNTDFLARFGGDEFALIMPETPLDIAARISRRIQAGILQTDLSILGDAGIPISLSVGLAEFPANGVTPEELVKSADTDLYKTKKKGTGRLTALVVCQT